ncbi:MAG TPA: GGDEF domain-containing protein [Candidatus Acidoferrum sp.]|nr:GGDEF domain-containing protein [Candidatus Acidoferrum sp.]
MSSSGNTERKSLDRRELQLFVLAIISMLVSAAGFAVLAYPAIFSGTAVLVGSTAKVCFFGFCLLYILLVGYLWERYRMSCRLRQQIESQQKRYAELRQQAGREFLSALPAFNQFQDRLVMEYRRATRVSDSFSVFVVSLAPAMNVADEAETTAAYGDAAKAISRKLRREDSLYRFSPDVFGVMLPRTDSKEAHVLSARLEEGLHDAAGAANRFSSVVKVFNYPQEAATARELEMAVRSLLPLDLISEPTIDTALEAPVPIRQR